MPERRTPLYDSHVRMARCAWSRGRGFYVPLSYTSPVEEHINTRTYLGMPGPVHHGEVDIKGPGAERLV